MHAATETTSVSPAAAARADELFSALRNDIYRRTDRLFALLLVLQWLAGVIAALVIAPRTWSGVISQTHIHIYAAVYLGGIITALPVAMAFLMPGKALTRHCIAIGQILFSSLLIHLTGGRIETHFHVFGSLAFLAVYRDWRVLITASLVVAIDHFLRGMFWPQSVYGVIGGAQWRFLEHAGWVIFEDIFLIAATRQSLAQMRAVAERQAMLEEAKRTVESADRAKSAFLAHMSHEIRTPMTAILGCAELMSAGDRNEEDREFVQTIYRNGEHLLTVLNDILDISKIEAGRLTIERVPCSVAEIVGEVASLMRPRAAAKGLKLECHFPTPIPKTIQTDPTRLRQILFNLVSNAIKFTERGEVRVTTAMKGSELALSVIDTGIGLTDEHRERLFKAFEQADGSTTRRYGGTGLGLAISKRLAEKLGGRIDVVSAPSRGSTFTVTLDAGKLDGVPMIEIEGDAAVKSDKAATKLETAARTHVRGRILLADDSTDNRQLLKRILEASGLEVEAVENGSQAVDRALASHNGDKFDLILMDMQMPEMDGYEATGRLRRSGYIGRIMAITAHASDADRERCLAAGCDAYVAKPYDVHRLLDMIRRQIEHSRSATPAKSTAQPAHAAPSLT